MPERRAGLDETRARELKEILDVVFELGGKSEQEMGLSPVEIIKRTTAHERAPLGFVNTDFVLANWLESHIKDSQLRIQAALVWGELYGAEDLSRVRQRAEMSLEVKRRIAARTF